MNIETSDDLCIGGFRPPVVEMVGEKENAVGSESATNSNESIETHIQDRDVKNVAEVGNQDRFGSGGSVGGNSSAVAGLVADVHDTISHSQPKSDGDDKHDDDKDNDISSNESKKRSRSRSTSQSLTSNRYEKYRRDDSYDSERRDGRRDRRDGRRDGSEKSDSNDRRERRDRRERSDSSRRDSSGGSRRDRRSDRRYRGYDDDDDDDRYYRRSRRDRDRDRSQDSDRQRNSNRAHRSRDRSYDRNYTRDRSTDSNHSHDRHHSNEADTNNKSPNRNSKPKIDAAAAIAAAAAAAAKINSQLSKLSEETRNKKSSTPPTTTPPVILPTVPIRKKILTEKVEINDLRNKYLLTKDQTLEMITKETGVKISTKGRYYPDKSRATVKDPPLYLLIEGEDEEAIRMAIDKIEEVANQFLGDLVDQSRFRRRDMQHLFEGLEMRKAITGGDESTGVNSIPITEPIGSKEQGKRIDPLAINAINQLLKGAGESGSGPESIKRPPPPSELPKVVLPPPPPPPPKVKLPPPPPPGVPKSISTSHSTPPQPQSSIKPSSSPPPDPTKTKIYQSIIFSKELLKFETKINIDIKTSQSASKVYESMVGEDNQNINHIRKETATTVSVEGKGSTVNQTVPMHFHIIGSSKEQVSNAREMCLDLLSVMKEQIESSYPLEELHTFLSSIPGLNS